MSWAYANQKSAYGMVTGCMPRSRVNRSWLFFPKILGFHSLSWDLWIFCRNAHYLGIFSNLIVKTCPGNASSKQQYLYLVVVFISQKQIDRWPAYWHCWWTTYKVGSPGRSVGIEIGIADVAWWIGWIRGEGPHIGGRCATLLIKELLLDKD